MDQELPGMSVCAICGEDASHKAVEITPIHYGSGKTIQTKDGRLMSSKRIIAPAVVVDLCARHYESHVAQQGWQAREEEKRQRNTTAAKARLKRNQTSIFDELGKDAA